MKKYITIAALFFSITSNAQTLDTVSVSLTLRAQDWAWAIGEYGEGADSASKARVRAIRTAIIAANPATWTTNVTINNVHGKVVLEIYKLFCRASFNSIIQMGSTTAERTTIYNNIRNINNSAVQFFISQTDEYYSNEFIRTRGKGKSIVMDN